MASVAEPFRLGPVCSDVHIWRACRNNIAHLSDGFQRHVRELRWTPHSLCPTGDAAADLCPPRDLASEELNGVDAVSLGGTLIRARHAGRYVGLGLGDTGCFVPAFLWTQSSLTRSGPFVR